MTELDAEIGPLALELIDEFGKSISYAKVTSGEYDTTTGEGIITAPVVSIKGIVEEFKGQDFASGLIEGGDKKITVAAQAFDEVPTSSDTVTLDNLTYTIVGVKTVYSGELPAIYELQARR